MAAPDGLAFLAEAEREGIAIEDPTRLDEAMDREVNAAIGGHGVPTERMTRLYHWLHGGERAFVHQPGVTSSAGAAFRSHRGDCMTHALLFVTLARALGVEAYYVRALTARQFADREDGVVAMTHVAVGFDDGGESHVVDVWTPVDGWGLARYERIDDTSALALYASNRAVADLHGPKLATATRTLAFLARRAPDVPEVHTNLVALLLRERRNEEALAVAQAALVRFPRFKPLYTNAWVAAMEAGQPETANAIEARGRALRDADPVFLFAHGVTDFGRGNYGDAARTFERALAQADDSIVIRAWLVRACIAAGDRTRGAEVFGHAWARAPNDARLKKLLAEHAELLPKR